MAKPLTKKEYNERLMRIRELVVRKRSVHFSEVAQILGRTAHIGINWCKIAASAYPDLFYISGYLKIKESKNSSIDEQWLAGFFDADGYLGAQPAKDKLLPTSYTIIPKAQINQRYIAGFLDGDGCISCLVYKRTKERGYEIQPQARLTDFKGDVLSKIVRFLASKGISASIYPNEKCEEGELVIYGHENLTRFLKLISPYLQTYKRVQALVLLNEILPRMLRKEHTTKGGFIKIMQFVDLLNELRNDYRPRKYTKAFFEQMWRGREEDELAFE